MRILLCEFRQNGKQIHVGYTIKLKLFIYVEKFCLYEVLCKTMYNVDAYALVKHALHVLQQIKKTTQGIAGSVCCF